MNKIKHILVITDDDNSNTVRMLLRLKVIPITRRSIISAIELLKHLNIIAIVIDKNHQGVDSIELILNIRDISGEIPIFIPEHYHQNENWNLIENSDKISLYNEKDFLLKQEISDLLAEKI